jgi:alpha-tubulin suppressor-like RCC1 family protein
MPNADDRNRPGRRPLSRQLAAAGTAVAAAAAFAVPSLAVAGTAVTARAAGGGTSARLITVHPVTAAAAGMVWGWGGNILGQLGTGHRTPPPERPVRAELRPGTMITAAGEGCEHSLALTSAGRVLAWGDNESGQLGNGRRGRGTDVPAPVRLPPGTRITAIRAGCDDSMALASTGRVFAWGDDSEGQLGDGHRNRGTDRPVRVRLPAGTKITAIAAGAVMSYALTSAGHVLAWGHDEVGELGTGHRFRASDVPVPVRLPRGTRVTAITAGSRAGLALTSRGTVLAWGGDRFGQLGDGHGGHGKFSAQPVRVKLPSGARVRSIFSGCDHTLALTTTGHVLGWGEDADSELLASRSVFLDIPARIPVPGHPVVTAVSAGCQISVILTAQGSVLDWGSNQQGQLGRPGGGTSTPTPVPLPAGLAVATIGSGPSAQSTLVTAHPAQP